MKITKQYLKQIINEELQNLLEVEVKQKNPNDIWWLTFVPSLDKNNPLLLTLTDKDFDNTNGYRKIKKIDLQSDSQTVKIIAGDRGDIDPKYQSLTADNFILKIDKLATDLDVNSDNTQIQKIAKMQKKLYQDLKMQGKESLYLPSNPSLINQAREELKQQKVAPKEKPGLFGKLLGKK